MPYIPSYPHSLFRPTTPLSDSKFTLNATGVAGFFGGDVAVSVMATVYINQGRKWLGWYNSPGSYLVAQRYGQLAKPRFWRGLFPGLNNDPATLFELDGRKGPMFKGVFSGSIITETGHLAALMERECNQPEMKFIKLVEREHFNSLPVGVTIVNLHHVPEYTWQLKQPRKLSRVPLTNHYSFLNLPKKPPHNPFPNVVHASISEEVLSDEDNESTPRTSLSNLPAI